MEQDMAGFSPEDFWRGKREIANGTGFSESKVLQMSARGEIPAFKLGAVWCMRPARWAALVREREDAALAGAAQPEGSR